MKKRIVIIGSILLLSGLYFSKPYLYPPLGRGEGEAKESHEKHDNGKHGVSEENGDNHKDGHDNHDENKEHTEHGKHGEEKAVRLNEAEIKEFGIEIDKAGPGKLNTFVSLPGEVILNQDRVAHIVPRVPGIVFKVRKTLGDSVKKGELMAVLESMELGQAKIEYLTLEQQLELAKVDLARIKTIHDNTARLLDKLKEYPDPEAIQKETGGLDMGENRNRLISAYTTLLLTKQIYNREKNLYEKKISSQAEFLEAESNNKSAQANYSATYDEISFSIKRQLLDKKRAVSLAESALNAAEHRLHILGVSDADLAKLERMKKHDAGLARIEIRAPFRGTVIEKNITLGEVLNGDSRTFVVADLSSVWVDLSVYQKDLPYIRIGQAVTISSGRGIPDAEGKISWIMPLVGEQTRTARARVALANPDGRWLPGLFVKGKIAVGNDDIPVLIPKSAIQTVEDKPSVFVGTEEGFEPRPITLGRENATHVEIISGLEPGQDYVKKGAFTLKAQLAKGEFGEGHGH